MEVYCTNEIERQWKLSISKKCVLKCAGGYKVRHVRGWLKFYYNGFLLDCALRNKVSLYKAKVKFQ